MDKNKLRDILSGLISHECEVQELKRAISYLRHDVSQLRLNELRQYEQSNSFDLLFEEACGLMNDFNSLTKKFRNRNLFCDVNIENGDSEFAGAHLVDLNVKECEVELQDIGGVDSNAKHGDAELKHDSLSGLNVEDGKGQLEVIGRVDLKLENGEGVFHDDGLGCSNVDVCPLNAEVGVEQLEVVGLVDLKGENGDIFEGQLEDIGVVDLTLKDAEGELEQDLLQNKKMEDPPLISQCNLLSDGNCRDGDGIDIVDLEKNTCNNSCYFKNGEVVCGESSQLIGEECVVEGDGLSSHFVTLINLISASEQCRKGEFFKSEYQVMLHFEEEKELVFKFGGSGFDCNTFDVEEREFQNLSCEVVYIFTFIMYF